MCRYFLFLPVSCWSLSWLGCEWQSATVCAHNSPTHCKLLVAGGLGVSVRESKRPALTPVPPGDCRWDWPVKNWGLMMISTENQEEHQKERNDPCAAATVPSPLCAQLMQSMINRDVHKAISNIYPCKSKGDQEIVCTVHAGLHRDHGFPEQGWR